MAMKKSSCPAGEHMQSMREGLAERFVKKCGALAGMFGHAGRDRSLFTAEGELKLAFEQREHLLEVVAVRSGAPAVRDVHVDQAVAASRFRAGQQDRVRVTDDADVA
jgi:hypothetical protein